MMYYKTNAARSRSSTRHATTVLELAVVLPVILLLILGTIDFGLVMYATGAVSEAARAGARYAMVHGSMAAVPVGPAANNATVQSVVQEYAVALIPANLTVTSSWGLGSNTVGNPVTVTVNYKCPLSIGHLSGLGSTVTVQGQTTMLITH